MHEPITNALGTPSTLRHARVSVFDGERFGVVSADGFRYWLKPALGCLLRPALGDTVLLSLVGDQGYILSVLERAVGQAGELSYPDSLTLKLPGGALAIQSRDGLALETDSHLSLAACQLNADLGQVKLALGELSVAGESSQSYWHRREEQSVQLHQQAVRHSCDYGDSQRRIQGHEHVSAGSVSHRVSGDYSLSGETLDLFAEHSVALDGQCIKLG